MKPTIHLGYEVGTGTPVEIPLRHMAVTGQTQESGKTTTLEALVSRANVNALAFVTKRGESAFGNGRRVEPYFRDRADWQFVTSIIDATLQEKNKFLRPWIMKICRTTRTLADVQREVRKALAVAQEKRQGLNEGVYTQLDAYLDLIVPEIGRHSLATTLDLRTGLNVMDVSASPTPMQMLFVQSAIDWVNEHAENTIVIVPEAWEFIPEGKRSPVKQSAVALVRKGAGIGNYIWVDSQDMAGVDKVILRGCAVWLIGVQREANEIKRNLANIPASITRPTAAQVATLERGQFYVCHGKHATKTYVQPRWIGHAEAQGVALGAPVPERVNPIQRDSTVNESEARALREENQTLKAQVRDLTARVDALLARERHAPSSNGKALTDAPVPGHPKKEMPDVPIPVGAAEVSTDARDYDGLLRRLRADLLKEPAVLRLLTEKPSLTVEVRRPTIEANGDTLKGRIARLLADGFFEDARLQSEVIAAMARTGYDADDRNTTKELNGLALLGFLTIEDATDSRGRARRGFKAVEGMLVNVLETTEARAAGGGGGGV